MRWAGDLDVSAAKISANRGKTWTNHEVPGSTGCLHMNVEEVDPWNLAGSLQESSGRQHLSQPLRRQRGTWTGPAKAVLPNNNSAVQFTRGQNDHSAIVFNDMGAERTSERRRSLCDDIEESSSGHERPAPDEGQGNESRAFWGAPRAPLTLAISRDEGQTWPKKRVLEVGDDHCMINNSRGKVNREFSYALSSRLRTATSTSRLLIFDRRSSTSGSRNAGSRLGQG
jgi:predicted neuraminidase